MNFGNEIKNEIIKKPIKQECCKKSFLSGYLRGSASLFYEDNQLGLLFYTYSEEVSNLLCELFLSIYGYEIRDVFVEQDRLNKKDKFTHIVKGEKTFEILSDLNIIKLNDGEVSVDLNFFSGKEKECCVKSFIKGLFLASGSCSVPFDEKGGFHLEIVFSHSVPAMKVLETLNKYSVKSKITRKKERYVLYIKSGEEIKNFIALLNTTLCVLKLTDLLVNREVVNKSNRIANCDFGNVTRQMEASEKQINAIKKIDEKLGLNNLKPNLEKVAKARLNHQTESITELSEILNISKSCLNHRLRNIVEISEKL